MSTIYREYHYKTEFPDRREPDDGFGPPVESVRVLCWHCGIERDSAQMYYAWDTDAQHGLWHCGTPGCNGVGFGHDLWVADDVMSKNMAEAMDNERRKSVQRLLKSVARR